jgi:hypothetical protein
LHLLHLVDVLDDGAERARIALVIGGWQIASRFAEDWSAGSSFGVPSD